MSLSNFLRDLFSSVYTSLISRLILLQEISSARSDLHIFTKQTAASSPLQEDLFQVT